VVGVEVGW